MFYYRVLMCSLYWNIRVLRLQAGHKYCLLGRLSSEVGWNHYDTIKVRIKIVECSFVSFSNSIKSIFSDLLFSHIWIYCYSNYHFGICYTLVLMSMNRIDDTALPIIIVFLFYFSNTIKVSY